MLVEPGGLRVTCRWVRAKRRTRARGAVGGLEHRLARGLGGRAPGAWASTAPWPRLPLRRTAALCAACPSGSRQLTVQGSTQPERGSAGAGRFVTSRRGAGRQRNEAGWRFRATGRRRSSRARHDRNDPRRCHRHEPQRAVEIGRSSAISASPSASSATGPLKRSTSFTFFGRLRVSRMPASPPHLRRPRVPSIFSISLP
jgi:hypothetical protein